MTRPEALRAAAVVDHAALRHNASVVSAAIRPSELWAVVKADAYGHGAGPVARTLARSGATRFCVALVEEGAALRRAGVEEPILVLSEPPPASLDDLVRHRLEATAYTPDGVAGLAAAVGARVSPVEVHVKVDTGMHRVGCAPEESVQLARQIRAAPGLRLAGTWTHLACADEPQRAANAVQLARFDAVLEDLDRAGIDPGTVHAANSAAGLALPSSRRHAVRAGIALYGSPPGPGVVEHCRDLRPALSLLARIGLVKRVAAGEGVSYGHRWLAPRATTVATVPVGYADGVTRRLGSAGAEVLIGGRRHPVVGTITMDQLLVDCGHQPVAAGDQAVLLGRQADEVVTVGEWAERLGTIAYEITCAISARVPRIHVGAEG